MNISIFGLGYVGVVCASCLANEGHQIVGVDLSKEKVHAINSGQSPILEPGINELLSEVVLNNQLEATDSADYAIENSDLSIVCVGTPSRSDGSMNSEFLERCCQRMGKGLAKKSSFHVFAFRSTIFPGWIRNKLAPIIEKYSGKKVGEDFSVCSYPEFLREGTAIHDFNFPARRIIGEYDAQAGDQLVKMFPEDSDIPIIRTKLEMAEMIKYIDNTWHGVKVAFANEVGSVCKQLNIDSHEVMRLFLADKKLNISDTYLMPGNAFGGSCLPKDIRALAFSADQLGIDLPLIDSLIASNQRHIERIVSLIQQQQPKCVGLIGIGFKSNTDDVRESPTLALINHLLERDITVKCYDDEVRPEKICGANQEYLYQQVPRIGEVLVDDLDVLLQQCNVLVINKHSEAAKQAASRCQKNQTLIDLVRINDDNKPEKYEGICW
ncbi:MAG: nucleotide sugar dehydrogenase [Gammaproteobacteria bacterium]|nr:nucleotide sugar dehydrogenase [Gammaproteobacteria bacterium]